MFAAELIAAWVVAQWGRMRGRDPEQGDVPGWVMVTVMTAILVVAIIKVFKGQITSAITAALNNVSSQN